MIDISFSSSFIVSKWLDDDDKNHEKKQYPYAGRKRKINLVWMTAWILSMVKWKDRLSSVPPHNHDSSMRRDFRDTDWTKLIEKKTKKKKKTFFSRLLYLTFRYHWWEATSLGQSQCPTRYIRSFQGLFDIWGICVRIKQQWRNRRDNKTTNIDVCSRYECCSSDKLTYF